MYAIMMVAEEAAEQTAWPDVAMMATVVAGMVFALWVFFRDL